MITAGPTCEAIDPVRFITNRSSGKMGYAIAEAARNAGAQVVLVSGPVALRAPEGAELISVESAQEMFDAVKSEFDACDAGVFTAAVCDYKPVVTYGRKLKKGSDGFALERLALEETPDILSYFAHRKEGRYVVGFAAETGNAEEYGKEKLARKGCDMIVANDVSQGKVFGSDMNEASLISVEGIERLPLMSKAELARVIVKRIIDNVR